MATLPRPTSSPETRSSRGRTLVQATCVQCGTPFQRLPSVLARAQREGKPGPFCSRGCSNAARTKPQESCKHCGGLLPKANGRTYCSVECRRTAFLLTLTCGQCGEQFQMAQADHAKKVRKGQTAFFCSYACSGQARAQTRPCVGCGTPMSNQQWRHTRYCSPACKTANPPKKGTRKLAEKPCKQCTKPFRPRSSRTEYCCRDCSNLAHAWRQTGSGNSRFKHGNSYAAWFRAMRPLILDRDGRRCVACKSPETFMTVIRKGKAQQRTTFHVHHINANSRDNRPENLVSLCKTCHAVHHKSSTTPWPWFAQYAKDASAFMTSRWKARATSLQARYSFTTA
ncbi:HNH endonuclease [Streptomyces sp. NPDC056291]|uniref:HNH endonuclease n=1 Tax=Streptomyces sp. NPDC056291 TaxID=3345772 RepID=UPI0035DC6F07